MNTDLLSSMWYVKKSNNKNADETSWTKLSILK